MKIIITGGTGLIGTHLTLALKERGHDIWILTRNPERAQNKPGIRYLGWDGKTSDGWGDVANGADAIVNLAGASIGERLWTSKRKKRIQQSRVNAGLAVVDAVKNASQKPRVLLQASGIDYYPSDFSKTLSVDTSPGDGFLSKTAIMWEESTRGVDSMGVRRVVMRTSMVLSSKGGSLEKIILPFRGFLGGPLGSGRQWWTWIHIEDVIRAMEFLIEENSVCGPVNLTSPNPLRMSDFGKILARVLNRPYWIPVPEFALKLALGEMASLVLNGRKVIPDELINAGFEFNYPDLQVALKSLLK